MESKKEQNEIRFLRKEKDYYPKKKRKGENSLVYPKKKGVFLNNSNSTNANTHIYLQNIFANKDQHQAFSIKPKNEFTGQINQKNKKRPKSAISSKILNQSNNNTNNLTDFFNFKEYK